MITLIAAQIGDGACQQGHIEQYLLLLTCLGNSGIVVLLDADHIAVDHHAVFIVGQPLAGVEGGIEKERVVFGNIRDKIAAEQARIRR